MIECNCYVENYRCKLKLILLSVIILMSITYPSINLLQYIVLYLDLHPQNFWFSLGVSILVSVASSILQCTFKHGGEPSTRATREHFRRVSMESLPSAEEEEEEHVLSTYSRLEHKFEELGVLGLKIKTVIQKEMSPRLNPERSSFSFSKFPNRVRSSGTMTPLALDVSPIEPDILAEATKERLLSKNINAFSSPFSQLKLKKNIEHLYASSDKTHTLSSLDNKDVFEKANRHIAESDIGDLSELQTSDLRALGDSHERSVFSTNLEHEETKTEDKVEPENKTSL